MFVAKEKYDKVKKELNEAKSEISMAKIEKSLIAKSLGLKEDARTTDITNEAKKLKSKALQTTLADKSKTSINKKKTEDIDWNEIDQLEHNQEYDKKIGDNHPDNADWKEIDHLAHNKEHDSQGHYAEVLLKKKKATTAP